MTDMTEATLLIDAGNTRVKFAFYESLSALTPSSKFALSHAELERLESYMTQWPTQPQRVIGVNVAGAHVAEQIARLVANGTALNGGAIEWLQTQPQLLHLRNSYKDHRQLGADRWLAMLGVSAQPEAQHRPAMLVSFGTATTVDTVYQQQFLGGLIFPGLQLMAQSLAQGTAQLPAIDWGNQEARAFPCSTVDALSSGMLAAQAGAVLRQWSEVVRHTEQNPVLYYAGGAARYVVPELTLRLQEQVSLHGFDTMELIAFEDPVLAGLLIYAQQSL